MSARTIAVSSFSVWENLGGLRIPITDDAGKRTEIVLPRRAELSLTAFPAEVSARFDVDAIEICQIQITDRSSAAMVLLRNALDQAGVQLINMPIDVGNVATADYGRREADLAEIESWIAVAAALGAAFCRVRAGFRRSPASLVTAVTSLRRLSGFASDLGVRLLIENQGGVTADPVSLLELLDAVGVEHIGLLLDTGNFEPLMTISNARTSGHPLPDRPLALNHIYTAIETLAPRAELVHAKGHEFDDRGEHTPFDLRRALEIVRDSGYAGPVSVEYEGMSGDRWQNTGRTLATVRSVFEAAGQASDA